MSESLGHSKRILIVDDNEDLRDLLKLATSRQHYQVTTVEDGVDALVAILRGVKEQSRYEVVILDCAMPFADGFSIVQAVRCLEKNHVVPERTKIGLYTGYPELLKLSTLLEDSDIDGYVEKPNHEELFLMIARLGEMQSPVAA